MLSRRHCLGLVLSLTSILLFTSCVYYNTFFWARKNFNQAEKKQQESLRAKDSQQDSPNPVYRGNQNPQQKPGGDFYVSPEAQTLYKNAIEKAARVLTYHPDSKWVPDALWVIGKSYFSMGDYILADLKFKELVTNHPNSKYADRAYFYMGLCQMNLEHDDEALSAFAFLETNFKKSPYLDDIFYAKGLMELRNENYSDAAGYFTQYIEKYSGDSSAMAMDNIGKCKEQLKDFWGAHKAYKQVAKYNPSKKLYFDATLASATTALASDSIIMGMNILETLGKNQSYFSKLAEIHLRTADGYYLLKKIDKADTLYKQVIAENPKTKEAAEAYYRLGLINQNDLFDLPTAKDNFAKAQTESSESEFRPLALARSAQIAKLESFQKQLQRVDSLRQMDELNSLGENEPMPPKVIQPIAKEDSTFIGPRNDGRSPASKENYLASILASANKENQTDTLLPFIGPKQDTLGGAIVSPPILVGPMLPQVNLADSSKVPSNQVPIAPIKEHLGPGDQAYDDSVRSVIMEKGIETRYLLAELYAYELNRPDSALQEYLLLVDAYPMSAYAPRALLAASQIELNGPDSTKAFELLRRLLKDYPESPQAAQAAQILQSPIDDSNNVVGLYVSAESLIYNANMPDSAIALFRYIADRFPDLAPKASFAIAWVLDQVEGVEDSSAYFAYSAVAKKYPETEFGIAAKKRLTAAPSVVTRPKPTTRDEPAQPDTTQLAALPDSTDQIEEGLSLAPPVITAPDFIYPEELLSRDLKGKVIFKIRLEHSGKVRDYEIIGPSGEHAIDSSATVTLMATEFDVSNLDLIQFDNYYQYSITFIRPKITNFFNPYLERQEQGP